MAKAKRYEGSFLSHANVVWRAEIWQEGYSGTVGELTFEADEPLQISWKHTDKEEVICGSEATLRIESPGDRTYEDLYTITAGDVRLDVYRNNSLYWSGTLDPEFYEEPYERKQNYPVSLTFSDFGILDRLKYDLSGVQTLHDILSEALTRCGIHYTAIDDTTYCTTYFASDTYIEVSTPQANLSALSIRSDNFFDEDGEASTLKEVVEGILQPLALRLVQRNGYIYVYDLNGLHTLAPSRSIVWDGDSQTMGVDKVASAVKVTFSPYSSAELLDGELGYEDPHPVEDINLLPSSAADHFTYYSDYESYHMDYDMANFTIFLSTHGHGISYRNSNAMFCFIQPLVAGPSECTAIAWSFYTGGHGALTTGWPQRVGNAVTTETNMPIMRTKRVFLPKLSDEDAEKYYIRLTLEMLLDARYNPFSEKGDYNEKGNYYDFEKRTGFAFVPIAVNIYDSESGGEVICHFQNAHIAHTAKKGNLYEEDAMGRWTNGSALNDAVEAYLQYYDPEDLEESSGIQGWCNNRQCFGRPGDGNEYFNSAVIYDSFKKMADGEYIPYPSGSDFQGGYLEVTVYAGVQCFDMNEVKVPLIGGSPEQSDWDSPKYWHGNQDGYLNLVRWLLYKAPKVDVVRNNLVFNGAELDDVEYSGVINEHAKEDINLDTICGTSDVICPTARGIYCRASDGLQIQELKRAGVTDHPEQLLIGTLCSQYACRRVTLSGESVLDSGGLCKYTEANQSGKVFMMSEEHQSAIRDTAEVIYTEFAADGWDGQSANSPMSSHYTSATVHREALPRSERLAERGLRIEK